MFKQAIKEQRQIFNFTGSLVHVKKTHYAFNHRFFCFTYSCMLMAVDWRWRSQKPITSRKTTYEFFPFDQKDLLRQIEKKKKKDENIK